jgi:hypothetical protein
MPNVCTGSNLVYYTAVFYAGRGVYDMNLRLPYPPKRRIGGKKNVRVIETD